MRLTPRLHPRTAIRRAIVAALKGNTIAGDMVTPPTMRPWREEELPAISVFTTPESTDADTTTQDTAPRIYRRTLNVSIEAHLSGAKTATAFDDDLDAFAIDIERIMDSNPTLSGTVSLVTMVGTDSGLRVDADPKTAWIRVNYTVLYVTGAPDPEDVDLNDFLRATVWINPTGAPADDADQVKADFSIPQE